MKIHSMLTLPSPLQQITIPCKCMILQSELFCEGDKDYKNYFTISYTLYIVMVTTTDFAD